MFQRNDCRYSIRVRHADCNRLRCGELTIADRDAEFQVIVRPCLGQLTLGDLPAGDWKSLTAAERKLVLPPGL